ncbi:MAG TPA: RNA polymerase sigma factor [Bacilli bacterium]|nr:RNA polymerase sigma factor [Bacilli bacterium]
MEQQWSMIYSTYSNEVFRFLLYYVGNYEEAEDLTQETFIKVVKNLKKFEGRSELKTWILTIARNLALDHLRKRKYAQSFAKLLGREPEAKPPLPEDLISSSERVHALHGAIQTLPDNYRAVVILRGIQELTPTEAAAVLGWNANKVNVVYHRAMKSLHKILEAEGDVTQWIGQTN